MKDRKSAYPQAVHSFLQRGAVCEVAVPAGSSFLSAARGSL